VLPLLLWGAEDLGADLVFLKKVERRLEEIERRIGEKGYDRGLAEELNSYGYPLYQLKLRYRNGELSSMSGRRGLIQRFYSSRGECFPTF